MSKDCNYRGEKKNMGLNVESVLEKIKQSFYGIIHTLLKYHSCSIFTYCLSSGLCFLQLLYYPLHSQVNLHYYHNSLKISGIIQTSMMLSMRSQK